MLAVLAVAACDAGSSSISAQQPRCEFHLPPAPATGRAPLGVLHDVAGGPTEYLLGSPDGPVETIAAATSFVSPQLAGRSLFFDVLDGQVNNLYRGSVGGCAYRVGQGMLGEVEPQGRAFTALVNNRWVMLDRDGHLITRLGGAAGTWNTDGRLIEPTGRGIDIVDRSGHKKSIQLAAGVVPLSPLGPHLELVSKAGATQLLDLDTGDLRPGAFTGQPFLGDLSGSPDGSHIAYFDLTGSAQVLDLGTGKTQALPAPARATTLTWSRDSTWVALRSDYGGVALRPSDGTMVDSGSRVVTSW